MSTTNHKTPTGLVLLGGRFPPDLAEQVRRAAHAEDRTISSFLVRAMRLHLAGRTDEVDR